MANLTRREVLRLTAAAGLAGVAGGSLGASVGSRFAKGNSLAYRSTVLDKGPVAYWRLGESDGPTAFDETANAYNGTYIGNPTYGQLGAINDDPDTAIQCNGLPPLPPIQDYVEIPDSVDFSQPTSDQGLSVEVWMRPDVLIFPGQTDRYVHWLGKGVRPQLEWAFRFYSQDTMSGRPNRISAYIWNPDDPPPALGAGAYFQDELVVGEWIHVVACYEPGDKDTIPPDWRPYLQERCAQAGAALERDSL